MTDRIDIWMPLYVKDYLGATSRLTTEQHGAYMLLIMDYWLNGPLPDDDAMLAQIARLSPEQWGKHRPSIERLFSVHEGQWRHRRIDREIEAARDRKKQAVERGKAGAKARWEKNNAENEAGNGESIEQASDKQSSKDSSAPSPAQSSTPPQSKSKAPDSKPSSSSQKREPDRSDEAREVFSYWQQTLGHPRAKLDGKRYKAIRGRLSNGYSVSDLCKAIDGCKRSPYHMGDNEQGTVYDDIELICRDAPHVDKFLKLSEGPDLSGMSGAARRTASAAQRFVNED